VAASTTSRALKVVDTEPVAVIIRKSQYDLPGNGKNGA
jgi:hypothetical protein